jgi:molybdenum cofactor biosynthesis protein B
MSVTEHRKAGAIPVPCFVLTISDTRTLETDASGAAIAAALTKAGHLVVGRGLVRDVAPEVTANLAHALEGEALAVITTGGTGIAARDTTFEAVSAMIDRPIPGFGELFRMLSFAEIGAAAMLSRACAGIARDRVLFALPGSQAAVTLAMDKLIIPELGHIVGELLKDGGAGDRIDTWLDQQT